MSDDVTPFLVDVPESSLADLRDRLRRTRWPQPETVDDWSQGTPLAYARELCRYWLQEYEWPAAQARLNRFPQFLTRIDDLDVHFVHVRSPHPGATPLVMTHGWPGSVVEFRKVIEPLTDPVAFGAAADVPVPAVPDPHHDLDVHFVHVRSPHPGATPLVMTHGWPGSVVEFRKVIEPLTDPVAFGAAAADAFHVVCPTLPGFGFSGKPARPGWGVERIADAWDQLMSRLGYPRYGAQGGDWGSR